MQHLRANRLPQAIMVCLVVGLVLVTSGCGGSQQSQAAATQSKAQLDTALNHARAIGVPSSALAPIQVKENQLNSTSAPFTLFDGTPATNYYLNQAKQYQQLNTQLQGVVSTTTDDASTQAQMDMQHFQQALASAQALKVGNLAYFTQEFTYDQTLLSSAQYPKDFATISARAGKATNALYLLASTHKLLGSFHTTIQQLQSARLDVTAMQAQYSSDVHTLNALTDPVDFSNLNALVDTQYQMAVVNSIQALPFVGNAKLGEFKTQINLLKTYGMDASTYQQLYNADVKQMHAAKSIAQYLTVSQKIDADMASMQNDLTQGASNYLITELDRQANAWGNAHLYHDKFDGHNYSLTAGYVLNGIGYWLKRELSWAWQPSDYQAVVADDNNEFFNLQMMEQDYSDKTPYNKVHQTDLELMQHYPSLQHGAVLMVSEVEQALRFYKDGKLIRAFNVTTGRVERPALPGYWTVQDRKAPDEFKSDDPPGSPYWYPPTHINYAILYHWGGFFVHDAWWRVNFGPGTQFPHYDVGGDESFAGNGSHGCINMQENDAAWVYANTDWNTQIMVY